MYATKLDANGNIKHKARYVAKGYSQTENVDYSETFSPTAHMTSVRMLMQSVADNNLLVHQMDVKTAYLNAPIDCELYVEQPEGYAVPNQGDCKLVWKYLCMDSSKVVGIGITFYIPICVMMVFNSQMLILVCTIRPLKMVG